MSGQRILILNCAGYSGYEYNGSCASVAAYVTKIDYITSKLTGNVIKCSVLLSISKILDLKYFPNLPRPSFITKPVIQKRHIISFYRLDFIKIIIRERGAVERRLQLYIYNI